MATAEVKNKGKDIPDDDPELQKIWDELDKVTGDDLRKRYAEFAKKYPQQLGGGKFLDEIDQQPEAEKPLEVPKEGRVKEWGANTDPSKWKIISMKRPKDKFKIVDENDKNVADQFTTKENAEYFIKYYIETHAVPTDNPGTKPDVPEPQKPEKPEEKPEEPEPEKPEKPTEKYAFPVPEGYEVVGEFSTGFKHWGRHETNYASGGSGPSERWDNKDLPDALNVLGGYEFNLGTEHGERGSDNVDFKMRSDSHNNKSGGWLIPYIEWEEDGTSEGGAGIGKEYPHPTTSHLQFNIEGKDAKVKNMLDGQWHGFLTTCYNNKEGIPTVHLWYNEKATGKMEDYVLLGTSQDNVMKPGPAAKEIDIKGGNPQSLQIRMDEVPKGQIRNAFACEIKAPD
jgi:hypothetical protein